jgi:hypothetical protein
MSNGLFMTPPSKYVGSTLSIISTSFTYSENLKCNRSNTGLFTSIRARNVTLPPVHSQSSVLVQISDSDAIYADSIMTEFEPSSMRKMQGCSVRYCIRLYRVSLPWRCLPETKPNVLCVPQVNVVSFRVRNEAIGTIVRLTMPGEAFGSLMASFLVFWRTNPSKVRGFGFRCQCESHYFIET